MVAFSPAYEALTALVDEQRKRLLAPPPSLTVSEWADQFRMVPSYSAESGQWVTDRTPYLREIMDSFSDIGVNKVVFKKCARIGATEAGLNMVGYFMHQDPCAIMIVQPTVDDAKDFSKEQLAPMIADSPVLASLVSDAVKDSKNTITAKRYPGGSCVIGGANSPRFFRRRTIRFLILEEINGYAKSLTARREGDVIGLAEKRTETMGYRRKIYANSTPTVKGECRISEEFDRSDQRRFHWTCPHCQIPQPLEWKQLKYKDRAAPVYECVSCQGAIDEECKELLNLGGEWIPSRPGRPVRGYHLNALYSPFVSWQTLVDEFEKAQENHELLQIFVNLVLGEAWEDLASKDLEETIKARAKQYEPEGATWRVPRGACVLVCGVDKQPGELVARVRAYGPGEQSWLIDRVVIRGDTSQKLVWAQLEDWRTTMRWRHEAGAHLSIAAMCVDSGDDPDPVYAYTKPLLAQYVFAVKGATDPNADILPKKFTKTRLKSRLYLIGTQAIKKRLFRRAAMAPSEPYTLDQGPLFMHWNATADATYFAEFFSQNFVRHEYRGRTVTMYVKKSGWRDESLDCEVYAYAALHIGPISPTGLQDEWERVMAEGDRVRAKEMGAPITVVDVPPVAARAPGGWLPKGSGGWRR